MILTYLQPDRAADPESFDAALFCVGGVAALLNEWVLDTSKTVTAHDFAAKAVTWCARVLQVEQDPDAAG